MSAAVIALGAGGASAAGRDAAQTLAGGGMLGPLTTIETSDGLPASLYELSGGGNDVSDTALRFLMSGLFALARTVTGFACTVVDWIYRFPVIDALSKTAQHVADAYAQHIVTPLGLASVFTAWAFAFGLFMVARGKAARGFGEIMLTLLIGAIAATSIVRPDVMLGPSGPLQQAQRAALQAATITTQATGGAPDLCHSVLAPGNPACAPSKSDGTKDLKKGHRRSCAGVVRSGRETCLFGSEASQVSMPITRTLTDVLIVQPFQLLQYGRLIDKSSPLYKDYRKGLAYGDGASEADACDLLSDKAGELCRKRSADDPCNLVQGPLRGYCEDDNGISPEGASRGNAQKKLLEKHGKEGRAAAAYMSDVSWDRVFGALFVLIAAVIMAIVVLAMAFAMVAAQFACVVAAAGTYVVFMWALLPGPNRMLLWRWVGVFASSTVVLFGVSVFIPLFGVAAKTLLSSGDTSLIERLLLLDALAVTALVMHRRLQAKGSNLGQAFASRMRFAKIGGSHTMGDQAAGMGMALAAMGVDRGSQLSGSSLSLAGSGTSPAHAAFAMRRAKLASGLAGLSDGAGMPGNPLSALGEARAEARRALAPLSVPMRAAQLAWVGPPRETDHRPGARGGFSPDGVPLRRRVPMVIDGNTGEVMSDPNQGLKPIGERLRERISRTRGGRVLLGAGRIAWHTTVGAPAGWTRMRRKGSDLTREANRQIKHYTAARERWGRDSRAGVRDASVIVRRGPIRHGYDRAMAPLRRANRLQQWIAKDSSSLRDHRRGGKRP
ncbi:hypothetical protein ACFY0Z_29440 [Streptomyces kronopolitis]|uniref:hypothetical protein n=1 Tax=Streptomyces kronopolitis TaxID=1612435 RepID=UPI0036BB5818